MGGAAEIYGHAVRSDTVATSVTEKTDALHHFGFLVPLKRSTYLNRYPLNGLNINATHYPLMVSSLTAIKFWINSRVLILFSKFLIILNIKIITYREILRLNSLLKI